MFVILQMIRQNSFVIIVSLQKVLNSLEENAELPICWLFHETKLR